MRSARTSAIHFADEHGIRAGFERGAVAVEPVVAVGDPRPRGLHSGVVDAGKIVGRSQRLAGLVEVLGIEDAREPAVETRQDRLLAHVDRSLVPTLDVGVLGREAAAVIRPVVRPDALHPTLADAAVEEPAEDVSVLAPRSYDRRSFAGERALLLGAFEQVDAEEQLVHDVGQPHPVGAVVPAHLRLMAQRDVFHVDEHLVAALAVPDLPTRVPRVVEDGAHSALRPRATAGGPVTVARRIVGRGRQDAVGAEPLGDGHESLAGDVLLEVPQYHRRGRWGSGSSWCNRAPIAALPGFGCGPASASW